MAFELDAALRIASVTVAEQAKNQLAGLSQSVSINFAGLPAGAMESVGKFRAALGGLIPQAEKVETALVSAADNIGAAFSKAAEAVAALMASAGQVGGTVPKTISVQGTPSSAQSVSVPGLDAVVKNLGVGVSSLNEAIAKIGPALIDALKQAQTVAPATASAAPSQAAADQAKSALGQTGSAVQQLADASTQAAAKIKQAAVDLSFLGTPATSIPNNVSVVGSQTVYSKGYKGSGPFSYSVPVSAQEAQAQQDQQFWDTIQQQAEIQKHLGGWRPGTGTSVSLPVLQGPQQLKPSFLPEGQVTIPGPVAPTVSPYALQQQQEALAAQLQASRAAAQGAATPASQAGGWPTAVGIPGITSPAPAGGGPSIAQKLSEAEKQMQAVAAAAGKAGVAVPTGMNAATRASADFADAMLLAGKRYAAFMLATSAPFVVLAGMREGAQNVIALDTAMTKLGQILDPTNNELARLKAQILDLTVATGTNSEELTGAAIKMAQAGFSGEKLSAALESLAKVPLLPAFEGIGQAADGLISVMGQFKMTVEDIPGVFDKLSEVSNKYAVEGGDLFEAIKRGGGTFAALGGSLDEYIAIVTTARQTTMESAEQIGTGLRTIFSRIGRPQTLEYLRSIGVETEDAKGQMLSLYRILGQTASVFQGGSELKKRDIAEQLGGLRQVGRTIAVLNNWKTVQEVLGVSMGAAGSVNQDVARGVQSLAKQIDILKAKSNQLVQSLAPEVFTPFVQFLTQAGTAAISLTSALSPLLKILLALGATSLLSKGLGVGAAIAGRLAASGAVNPGAAPAAAGLFPFLAARYGAGQKVGLEAAGKRMGLEPGVVPVAPGLSGNPVAQLAVLAVLGASFDALGKEAKKTGHEFVGAGLDAAKAGVLFVAVASMLRMQSPGKFIKDIVGYGRGGVGQGALALGGAAALLGGVALMSMDNQLQKAIEAKVNQAADAIQAIPVPEATKSAEVKDAEGQLLEKVISTIDETAAMYDGVLGVLRGAGHRLNTLVEGILSFDVGKVGEAFSKNTPLVDGEKIMKDLYGQSPALLQAALESSIRTGGQDYRSVLKGQNVEKFRSMGKAYPEELADLSVKTIIEKAGGAAAVAALMKKVTDDLKATNMGEEFKRVAKSLSEIMVPPNLASQFITLGKAVEEASKKVMASVGAYDAQLESIQGGGINAPRLPIDFDTKATEKLLAGGGLTGMETSRPALQNYAEIVNTMKKLSESFIESVSNAQMEAVAYNKKRPLGAPAKAEPLSLGALDEMTQEEIDASRGELNNVVMEFLKQNKVPMKLRDSMHGLLRDIGEAVAAGADFRGAGINKKTLEELYTKHLKSILLTGEDITSMAQQEIGARMTVSQKRGEFLARDLQKVVNRPATPESQYETTKQLLQQAGVPLQVDATRSPTDLMKDTTLIDRLGAASTQVAGQLADVLQTIYRASQTGEMPTDAQGRTRSITDVMTEFEGLRAKSLMLQSAIESLSKSIGSYDQYIGQRMVKQQEANQIYLDLSGQRKIMQETLSGGGSGPGWGEQEELLRKTIAAMDKPLAIAKQIREGPPEGNRELSTRLGEAMNEERAALAEYYQQQIQLKPNTPDYADVGKGGVTQRLKDSIEKFNEIQNKIFESKVSLGSEKTTRDIAAMQEKLASISIASERIIAEKAGLNDPFGSHVFSTAVDKFEKAVLKMSLREEPPTAPARFEKGADGIMRPVMSRFNQDQQKSLEQAMFGGMSKGDLILEASKFLTGPNAPSRTTTSWNATPDGTLYPDTTSTPIARSLSELRKLNPTERDPIVNQMLGTIKAGQPTGSIDQATEARMRQYLIGGDLGAIGVDEKVKKQFGLTEDFRRTLEESKGRQISAATQPAGVTTQPTGVPTTGQAPVAPLPTATVAPSLPSLARSPARGGYLLGSDGRMITTDGKGITDMGVPPALDFSPATWQQDILRQGSAPVGPVVSPSSTSVAPAADLSTRMDQAVEALTAIATAMQSSDATTASTLQEAASQLSQLNVPGLAESAQATADNSQALSRVEGKADVLAAGLDRTAQAISDGLDMKLDAVQKIDVSINGLPEAIAGELKPAIEAAAAAATRRILYQALIDLANGSDTEGSQTFMAAARNLA